MPRTDIENGAPRLRPLEAYDRQAHVSSLSEGPRLWPWVAGAVALAAAAGAAFWLEHFARPTAAPVSVPPHNVNTLAWPALAVAILVACYFFARRSGEASDVTNRP